MSINFILRMIILLPNLKNFTVNSSSRSIKKNPCDIGYWFTHKFRSKAKRIDIGKNNNKHALNKYDPFTLNTIATDKICCNIFFFSLIVSRVLFPVIFATFNLSYWCYYLTMENIGSRK